ncbi:MAG: anthranilate synthase component I [Pseudomonadota bacterium]|nr:anthranilate synthase component I [Pseudomonadota bacterium]
MKEQEFLNYVSEGYKLIPLKIEIKLEDINPLDIYKRISNKPRSYFFESLEGGKKWSRYTIIGLPSNDYLDVVGKKIHLYENGKESEIINADNPIDWIERFHSQFKVLEDKDLPQFQGGLVGYFGFDSIKFIETKLTFSKQEDHLITPDISLIISKEILIFDKINNLIYIIVYAENNIESFKRKQKRLNEIKNILNGSEYEETVKLNQKNSQSPITYHYKKDDFLSAVNKIKKYITAGDVMQVVLSQRMSMPFNSTPIEFYHELRNINPSPYMYYLNMGDYFIIGSSPEILVRLESNIITVRPIAGTRPRGKDKESDKLYEKELSLDPKENAEHLMLIDLGRNDVGKVSKIGSVKLTENMIIEKYSHVMHMVSNVIGEIKENITMTDVLKATFPAGTVTGAPKIRAIEIIYELESLKRGIYAGAIGYLGWNGNMDTAIAIRTCVIKDNILNIQCGAGIVNDSIPENEWVETINKGKAILQAYTNLEERENDSNDR